MGVPPLGARVDSGGAFVVRVGVGTVFQERLPAAFPGRVGADPRGGFVEAGDVHQREREGA